MDLGTTLDWEIVQSIVIALALGALIGLERQSHYEEEHEVESVGLRTFALAALLGCLSVLAAPISPAVPYIAGAGYLLLVVTFLYFESRARETKPGITTQVSALLVYVIGVIVPAEPVLAAVVAVLVASILSIKDWTHRMVENLSEEEVVGTMKFLLVSVVLLPILPEKPVDPWGIYDLQEIWLLVVLISGISFLGYFAIRFFGRDRGIALTGALGGLASSTAVTLAMCQRVKAAKKSKSIHLAAAFAILIASGIMTVRVIILILAVSRTLAMTVWIPLGAMAVPGGLVSWWFWYRMEENGEGDSQEGRSEEGEELAGEEVAVEVSGGAEQDREPGDGERDLEISNPFELSPALKFGALFAVIIGGVYLARQFYGSSGTYAASFLSGLANMDAISVTIARMVESESVSTIIGVRGVVIAIIANSISKAVLSLVLGSRRLGGYVALGLLPMIAVGTGVAMVLH